MIIVLILVILFILALIGTIKHPDGDCICVALLLGLILMFVGAACISTQMATTQKIEENNIEYEALCKKLELMNSDYEDISKDKIITEVTNWNVAVSKDKYWGNNPFTSWFYNKRVVDNKQYIHLN